MKKRVALFAVVSVIAALVLAPVGLAQGVCATIDRALGFATEKALDSFLSLAKKAANDPSKGADLKKLLRKFLSENEAFDLKGGDKVTILVKKQGDDPSTGKMKVQAVKDKRVFWVPSGALNCN